ncbi:MAG: type IX secretion system membrane protein PorP/SprF, partial [Chitinophagia bacterium]|nr:type IX secretion system membrane protein PorP/SprF [Chitinophagia bacterium]
MKINKIASAFLGIAGLVAAGSDLYAQDIHFSQFDMQPLTINPAYTGMYYGKSRANAIYRRQWASVTVPYVTYGVSADMPVYSNDQGDYLATGIQLFNDVAGDGNLTNFTGLASVAYHKTHAGSDEFHGSDLALGFQAGYAQKSIDLSKLFFADEFFNGSYSQATSQEYGLGLGQSVNTWLVNVGVCFSKAAGQNFSYTIGGAAYNLNKPNEALSQKRAQDAGLDMRYTALVSAIWAMGDGRLSFRPSFFYQYQATATEMIGGNEFHYSLTDKNTELQFTPAVFVGLYTRTGDAAMVTLGA